MLNICETRIIPKGCSEVFLPLDTPSGKGLATRGIELAGISELKPGYRIARPDCPFHLVLFTCRGSGLFESDTLQRPLAEKDILVAPAHSAYRYKPIQTPWTIVWFHMVPGPQWQLLEEPVPVIKHGTRAHRLEHIARAFCSETFWEASPDLNLISGLSLTLFQMLLRELALLKGEPQEEHRATISKLFERVDTQLDADWNVDRLARSAALSPSHFSALTRRIMGMPPMQILTRLRMQRAMSLLEHTAMPAYAVARQVGYDDPFAFSVAFKRHCGASPRTFRNRCRDIRLA
jgi:AraC family transcriptional regulator, arabinose operon regulatory protein